MPLANFVAAAQLMRHLHRYVVVVVVVIVVVVVVVIVVVGTTVVIEQKKSITVAFDLQLQHALS